jgi:hypothetical protein
VVSRQIGPYSADELEAQLEGLFGAATDEE